MTRLLIVLPPTHAILDTVCHQWVKKREPVPLVDGVVYLSHVVSTSLIHHKTKAIYSCVTLHMHTHTNNVIIELIQCPSLNIPNGMVEISPNDRTINSTATYSCNNGLSLDGNSVRFCQMDGTWSGTEPTCSKLLLSLIFMQYIRIVIASMNS